MIDRTNPYIVRLINIAGDFPVSRWSLERIARICEHCEGEIKWIDAVTFELLSGRAKNLVVAYYTNESIKKKLSLTEKRDTDAASKTGTACRAALQSEEDWLGPVWLLELLVKDLHASSAVLLKSVGKFGRVPDRARFLRELIPVLSQERAPCGALCFSVLDGLFKLNGVYNSLKEGSKKYSVGPLLKLPP